MQLLGALDRPTDGVVQFEGRDLGALGDGELAKLRLNELDAVEVPVLVVQGERDPFGRPPPRHHRDVVMLPT